MRLNTHHAATFTHDLIDRLTDARNIMIEVQRGQQEEQHAFYMLADILGGIEAGVMGLNAAIISCHPDDSLASTREMAIEVRDALDRYSLPDAERAAFPTI